MCTLRIRFAVGLALTPSDVHVRWEQESRSCTIPKHIYTRSRLLLDLDSCNEKIVLQSNSSRVCILVSSSVRHLTKFAFGFTAAGGHFLIGSQIVPKIDLVDTNCTGVLVEEELVVMRNVPATKICHNFNSVRSFTSSSVPRYNLYPTRQLH